MSNTKKADVTRSRNYKIEGEYMGRKYEGWYAPSARRFVKKVTHKASRRLANKIILGELV